MNNNKLFSVLKVIVGSMVILAGAVNLIRGIISGELWTIVCFAGFLILVVVMIWIRWNNNKPIDERIKDPVYMELRSYLRDTLLPAGFEEEQTDMGLGFTTTYSLGELSVRLGKDIRENQYFFGVASKPNFVEMDGKSVNVPNYDDIEEYGGNLTEGFKSQVREKLTDWLASRKAMESGIK
jgi:hypothetical protein